MEENRSERCLGVSLERTVLLMTLGLEDKSGFLSVTWALEEELSEATALGWL